MYKQGSKRGKSAAEILVLGFMVIILIGTLLLMLPAASESGESASWYDALFTAVSTTCVTGLVTVDTATQWSLFGEIVTICLIQIGGLGFMTVAVLLSNILRRRVSPKEQLLLAESLSIDSYSGLEAQVRRIILGTASIEGVGAILLSIRFIPLFGWKRGIYYSVYHSVSAFCNAGFDVLGGEYGKFNGLTSFYGDALVSLTICALIILGGIGFVVWDDVRELITKRRKLSVYSKFMLTATFLIIVFGTVATAVLEWNNSESIGGFSTGEKILSSLFASVTLRTAGFSTVDFSTMKEPTQYIMMVIMFIGGGAGSTAGGVKVVTFATAFLAVISTARGKKDVNVFRRRIPEDAVMKAFSVIVIQLAVTIISAIIISAFADASMAAALFETFSASATVGLSLSLTPTLSVPLLMIDIMLMFFGRVGILTVTYALAAKEQSRNPVIYADVKFPI